MPPESFDKHSNEVPHNNGEGEREGGRNHVLACTSSSKIVGTGEKNFGKKPCGGSENFDFKEGLYYGLTQFFERGLQGIFGENRKLYNCCIIN